MADQGAEGLLSPWLRKKRLSAARLYLEGQVLDFGCGSGALAGLVSSDHYLGVDVDDISLERARLKFPQHRFASELPASNEKFDRIVSLAVIEHVSEPVEFLRSLAAHLNDTEGARLVLTTPHPLVGRVYHLGAAVGLFSRHANEEHEDLMDRAKLEMAGSHAGLELVTYRRFLFGANQIAVFRKNIAASATEE